MEVIETKKISMTARPLEIVGEVAVGIRSATDAEFKAAARLLLTKFQNAPAAPVVLEAVAA